MGKGMRRGKGREAVFFVPPPSHSIPDYLLGGVYGLLQKEEKTVKGAVLVVYGLIFMWIGLKNNILSVIETKFSL